MSRPLQTCLGIGVVLLLIAVPVGFTFHLQGQTRNFRAVRPGVLYRSGQMTLDGLRRVIHDHGIKTVICLRDGQTASDQEEEEFCALQDIRFVRIPPSSWGDWGGVVPAEEGVRTFR